MTSSTQQQPQLATVSLIISPDVFPGSGKLLLRDVMFYAIVYDCCF